MSGDLEQSLREKIEAHLDGRLGELREEVTRLRSQLDEGLARLSERLQEAGRADDALAVTLSEHLLDARNRGIETAAAENTRTRQSSEVAILKAAVEDLNAQQTQADILNALVNRAARFAPRVAFFVVKQERATGWRARGLEGTVGDDSVREISLPLSAETLLGEAVRARRTWSGPPGSHSDDHQIYGRFGEEPPERIVAVPLVARDKAVAVLYADSAAQDADAINLEAIETLMRVAGMSVELLAARRGAGQDAAAPARAPEPTSRPQETAPQESAASPSFQQQPTPAHETTRAEAREEYAAQPTQTPPPADVGFTQEQQPHVSAVALEDEGASLPPPHAVAPPPPPQQAPYAAPLGSARRYGQDIELPVEVGEGERRYHTDAYRFARVLVSEIKLYNEQKVREGLAAGDLYERLRDVIDRSREMYDKRISSEVTARYDYFHHELVNALAGGDASRLGEGYPGSPVRA
ncbi:MAG TPA: GAF domain-containing protein [Pyrinomonadaceae bacterium]|nr:GAF domain-containing protein [Pyrinomonadaceae bacterium]